MLQPRWQPAVSARLARSCWHARSPVHWPGAAHGPAADGAGAAAGRPVLASAASLGHWALTWGQLGLLKGVKPTTLPWAWHGCATSWPLCAMSHRGLAPPRKMPLHAGRREARQNLRSCLQPGVRHPLAIPGTPRDLRALGAECTSSCACLTLSGSGESKQYACPLLAVMPTTHGRGAPVGLAALGAEGVEAMCMQQALPSGEV